MSGTDRNNGMLPTSISAPTMGPVMRAGSPSAGSRPSKGVAGTKAQSTDPGSAKASSTNSSSPTLMALPPASPSPLACATPEWPAAGTSSALCSISCAENSQVITAPAPITHITPSPAWPAGITHHRLVVITTIASTTGASSGLRGPNRSIVAPSNGMDSITAQPPHLPPCATSAWPCTGSPTTARTNQGMKI